MKKFRQILKNALLAMILTQSCYLPAQTPKWSVLTHTSGIKNEYAYSSSVGPNGNVYYIGNMQGDFTIDGNEVKLNGTGFLNGFIGHHSPNGTNNWAFQIWGKKISVVSLGGVTADPFGNVFFRINCFGGAIGDTLHVGPNYFKLLTKISGNNLIVKMDSLGKVLWTNEINPNSANPGTIGNMEMMSDSKGDVYLAGYMVENQVFDTITVKTVGRDANFLAKCSANGKFLWAKSFGCKGNDGQSFNINRNEQNEVYLSGGWEGDTMFIENKFLVNPTPGGFFNTDRYIAKFSASGALQWMHREGSLDSDEPGKLVVMPNGDVICQSNVYTNPLSIVEGQTITGPTLLHTKYDVNGKYKSHKKMDLTAGMSTLVTDGKDLYLSTSFDAPKLTFGGITLNNAGGTTGTTDIAVFKLDTLYNVKWGVSVGASDNEVLASTRYSKSYGLLIAGNTSSSKLIVGSDTINNIGSVTSEGFLLTLNDKNSNVAINELSSKISVYPNPTKEILYLKFTDAGLSPNEVTVLNNAAQVVLKQTIGNAEQAKIDVKDLQPGFYILEMKIGNSYAFKKFIKE